MRGLTAAMVMAVTLAMFSTVQADPIFWSANGHYYNEVAFSGTWNAAALNAQFSSYDGYQGYLATFNTEAEYNFIKTSGLLGAWDVVWIGASQDVANNVNWANYEGPVNVTGWSPNPWDAGQPGTGHYGIDLTGPGYGSLWQANSAAQTYGGYLIEYGGASAIPEPSAVMLMVVGLGVCLLFRRRQQRQLQLGA